MENGNGVRVAGAIFLCGAAVLVFVGVQDVNTAMVDSRAGAGNVVLRARAPVETAAPNDMRELVAADVGPRATEAESDIDVRHLITLLDDPLVAIREDAVEQLAARDGEEVLTGLAYALSDENAFVRRLAIESLTDRRTDAAVAALTLVAADPNAGNRRFAVDALRRIETDTARLALQAFGSQPDEG